MSENENMWDTPEWMGAASDVFEAIDAGQRFKGVARDRARGSRFTENDCRIFLNRAFWRVKRAGLGSAAECAIATLDTEIRRATAEGATNLEDPENIGITLA